MREITMPRNPKRIREICDLIYEIWINVPDLRLGQLLQSFGAFTNSDNFYIEDDKTELSLRKSAAFIRGCNEDKPKAKVGKSFLTVISTITNLNSGIAAEKKPNQLTIFLFWFIVRIAWDKEILS
jgi:hypothetical protein